MLDPRVGRERAGLACDADDEARVPEPVDAQQPLGDQRAYETASRPPLARGHRTYQRRDPLGRQRWVMLAVGSWQ